jgi:hypothetical protein
MTEKAKSTAAPVADQVDGDPFPFSLLGGVMMFIAVALFAGLSGAAAGCGDREHQRVHAENGGRDRQLEFYRLRDEEMCLRLKDLDPQARETCGQSD